MPGSPALVPTNYCISFIDLLGQRDALRGQGLLPAITTEAGNTAYDRVIQDTIVPILQLQRDVENMVKTVSPQVE